MEGRKDERKERPIPAVVLSQLAVDVVFQARPCDVEEY